MRTVFGLTAILLAFGPVATADRGAIPFDPSVSVFEPRQRAMIAWNGQEEILILSTDLRASAPTKVLEVIPLPAEPRVTKGDLDVFRKANALIYRSLLPKHFLSVSKAAEASRGTPAGEITFHERIGSHDVSVARVKDAAGFIDWVESYLRSQGVNTPTIPSALESVVAEYLSEGFVWFVFDVVELDATTKTRDAIQYRFETDKLFYPLKITRAEKGKTSVQLLVLTPNLLRNFPCIPMSRIRLVHAPVAISSTDLARLSQEMADLFYHREGMRLRMWQIEGRLSEFRQDLVAH